MNEHHSIHCPNTIPRNPLPQQWIRQCEHGEDIADDAKDDDDGRDDAIDDLQFLVPHSVAGLTSGP